jgi:hypothetical protein
MISLSFFSISGASAELGPGDGDVMNISELGAGLRPLPPFPIPKLLPTLSEGRGRAGLFDQDPAGLDVPDDMGPMEEGHELLLSNPGIVRAFILALISSALAFMMVGLGYG